jgi:hypothetical protein
MHPSRSDTGRFIEGADAPRGYDKMKQSIKRAENV